MVMDYANKPEQPQKRRRKPGLVTLAVLLAIAAPLSLFYFRYQNVIHSKSQLSSDIPVTQPTAKKKAKNEYKDSHSDFTFYTLLPSSEVKVSSHEVKANEKNPAWEKMTFILQAGSLRQQSRAMKLRNQLSHIGYSAFIEEYKDSEATWYRVLLGPYNGIASAERDQRKLQQQHINSIMLKLKPSA